MFTNHKQMKKTQFILLVAFAIGFVTIGFAQKRPHGVVAIKNGFGIEGGITQFDILTDNFVTEKGNGWLGGASATGDIPHKWYNVSYTIQLSENTVGISAKPFALATTTTNSLTIKYLMLKSCLRHTLN